ncbi:hypothetical protein AWH51_01695 [Clavibacter tessellarius]|uniref:Ferritin-like domain-containing protein n=2 Tax=Microbacteriaceae TaxID=85023 RepID=A0A154UXL7_9MICO|nr:hypothetical protein AWH51_01695 [Clavibacter michiganensis subsp. tessellarius]
MLKMFGRRSTTIEAPRVRSRGESKRRAAAPTVSVDDFSPDTLRFLGAAAYLQLTVFETLSRAVTEAPDLAGKEAVSTAAGIALGKHQALAAEIKRLGGEPSVVMEPHRAAFDRFTAVVAGADWFESLISAYITTGLLDDFFVRLASALPSDQRQRVVVLLSSGIGQQGLVDAVRAGIRRDPRLASRLAMWGRRLVGDTLLVAGTAMRASLADPADARVHLEPVFAGIITAHTRRMDALGLTA